MTIKIRAYDFFAYTIPGGIFVAAFGYILQKYQLISIDLANLSTLQLLILAGLSYLVGYFVNPLVYKSWYRLFRSEDLFERTMTEFNRRQPSLEVNFLDMDWSIFFAFIKKHDSDMALDIDQLKVINVMLRNSSFGSFVFAVIFFLDFIDNVHVPIYAIGSAICLLMALVLGKESVKFQIWFYEGVFQHAIALVLEPKQLPVKLEFESKPLPGKRQAERRND